MSLNQNSQDPGRGRQLRNFPVRVLGDRRPDPPGVPDAPAPCEPVRFYSSKQVTRLCGVTHRQLQWWDEQKILSPAKIEHGRRRRYAEDQLREIHRLREASAAGIHVAKAARLLPLPWLHVVLLEKPRIFGDILVIPRAYPKKIRKSKGRNNTDANT